jgi:hypothetical protein
VVCAGIDIGDDHVLSRSRFGHSVVTRW